MFFLVSCVLLPSPRSHTHACECTHTHKQICICVYTHADTWKHTDMPVHAYIQYTCCTVHACTHTYMHASAHTHTHTHTHTHRIPYCMTNYPIQQLIISASLFRVLSSFHKIYPIRHTQRELKLKNPTLKDSSIRTICTYLTASPCYNTNTNKHNNTTNKHYEHN